jgi:prepilin-type N-terminal cleavage/methylation domain-containing protein
MHWPARMRDEDGFTLPELMIGMVIMSLLIVAIAGALIVSLKTTGATEQRLHESQDVLITSSYVANDVQSAAKVEVAPGSANCAGSFITLVTFRYSPSAQQPAAVYQCGTASNGETQVTRSFNNGDPIVVAHFAGAARPNVTVSYDSSTPPVPMSVTMRFTKPSDCTLDCTYTLFGSRRSYNPTSVTNGGSPLPGDAAVLSTGAGSPLTVQGKCDDPGTSPSSACTLDPTLVALPINPDVQTGGWPTPPSLWSVLGDQNQATSVTNTNTTEARVTLSPVNPPDTGFTPLVEIHATKISGSAPKVTFTVYDGASNPTCQTKAINGTGNYDCQVSGIATTAYPHLVLGFKVSNGDIVQVDGIALDTATPQGLLTIKGPLLVNSTNAGAVRLYGAKSGGSPQLTITNGDFRTLATDSTLQSGGTCSGCTSSTVKCTGCTWQGQNPVSWYYPSIPDPLRSLPAPPASPTKTCADGGICQPGTYTGPLALTKPTQLSPGIYVLKQGLQVSGTAAITCVAPCTGGVMLYIDVAGSVSFTGQSSVNLPALKSKVFANGLYDGIVMFQAHGDTNAVKIAGTSGPNALDGIVYVPDASQVTLATGNSTFSAKAIVAQNIKVSSPVTIG